MYAEQVNGGYSRETMAQAKARLARKKAEEDRTLAISKMRQQCVPMWVGKIVLETAAEHRVSPADMMGQSRYRRVVRARNEAFYRIKSTKPALSMPQIGRWFLRDHTSILHSIASHSDATGAPKLCGYDLAGVRRRNAEASAALRARKHLDRET